MEDWLDVLAACQARPDRESEDGAVLRTLTPAVLRGALPDLLATDDERSVTAAVHRQPALLHHDETSGT
ncbi:hypothetical protein [Streptomyces scabiei]|uniref:hypothetical protein n=1 Tax=Streptomyces scabiei TaxID=1930 RepID=UPI0039F685C5